MIPQVPQRLDILQYRRPVRRFPRFGRRDAIVEDQRQLVTFDRLCRQYGHGLVSRALFDRNLLVQETAERKPFLVR